jgi:hypothetical protein
MQTEAVVAATTAALAHTLGARLFQFLVPLLVELDERADERLERTSACAIQANLQFRKRGGRLPGQQPRSLGWASPRFVDRGLSCPRGAGEPCFKLGGALVTKRGVAALSVVPAPDPLPHTPLRLGSPSRRAPCAWR